MLDESSVYNILAEGIYFWTNLPHRIFFIHPRHMENSFSVYFFVKFEP